MWHTLQINAHLSATSFEINQHLKCEIDQNWKTIVLKYLLANKKKYKQVLYIVLCYWNNYTIPPFDFSPQRTELKMQSTQI